MLPKETGIPTAKSRILQTVSLTPPQCATGSAVNGDRVEGVWGPGEVQVKARSRGWSELNGPMLRLYVNGPDYTSDSVSYCSSSNGLLIVASANSPELPIVVRFREPSLDGFSVFIHSGDLLQIARTRWHDIKSMI